MRVSFRLARIALALLALFSLPGCDLIMRRATIAYVAVNSHFEPKRARWRARTRRRATRPRSRVERVSSLSPCDESAAL